MIKLRIHFGSRNFVHRTRPPCVDKICWVEMKNSNKTLFLRVQTEFIVNSKVFLLDKEPYLRRGVGGSFLRGEERKL